MDAADDVEDGANAQAGAQAQAQPPQAVALVALEQSIARSVEAIAIDEAHCVAEW